jgi:chromosomal replication initiator protein
MATGLGTVWSDVLGQVRLNHPQLVRGWFGDLQLTNVETGIVRIQARNHAQFNYLQRHCRVAFLEASQAATGRLVSVVFEVEEAESAPAQPSVLPFATEDDQLVLNPDCTFDHFVTGPCNRLAHAAALAVADEPGRVYNPFFIHGATGLGKTHLLQAICHAIRQQRPETTCHYISCETFINHFIEAVEHGLLHQFRYRYRHVGALVIDDIQFLAERERSQEEFFHTFNTLHQSQRQIVLSADCSPSEIPSLEERLVSRFNSGLVALMDHPGLETRMAIIRKKAKLRCIEVPEDVVRLIAARVDTNIRALEGTLIKIDAVSQMHSGKIALNIAKEVLGADSGRPVEIPTILETVAKRLKVKVSDLQGKKRSKAITYPRHVSMYLARELTSRSLEEIGGYFGGRDHSTVLHASRTIAKQAEQSPELQELLDEIVFEVKNVAY